MKIKMKFQKKQFGKFNFNLQSALALVLSKMKH